MQEHFNEEIENLKTSLIKMATLVDDQVERVFTALETGDITLCKGIKAKDLEIDIYDNLIQTQCENILALFQPVAIDLRFVLSALMTNNQLERCGDIAVNIAQRVKKTTDMQSLIKESQILDMGQQAKEMLKNAIDALILNDLDIAQKVLESDEIVDNFNKQIFLFLVERMKTDIALIEPCSHLIVLIRNIERLADHATNIAENLVFYLEAKNIKHQIKLNPPTE
ncbi:MAG: phosphate signaling complex protein PhoU [Ignavibacteriaceae bacterium]|nr:phosphate signaling complex protein PhoU [Ignavibacteriaceae bacterium]